MEPILSQGYGYGFAVGLGAAFALLMAVISNLLSRYAGQVQNSERFSTASRNVGAGLIASSTVSAWTWPATLLTAGTWSYVYGVSGGWLYGVGGTIQVSLFVFLALKIKQHAPAAHTLPETFYIRFGKGGHLLFICYCAATNIIVSALLLLGGSQAFSAATGMHTVAASFLLPLNVVIYTALGGLKATFISDWVHTVIIYVILIVSAYTVFCSSSLVGSPARMWELLKEVQKTFPASGKSFLSFKDKDLILLTWSVMLGGLSSVFGDPGYSQRAIAADYSSVFMGYMSGSICWWVIPFALGSSAGLACRALLTNTASVTYPRALSEAEVGASLPMIYGLAAIFGKSGAAAGLVMIFMSVTSATSAELIAFSSITTYDVYRTYFNPKAKGKGLMRVSHIAVLGFGILMAALSVVFNYIGVTVSWLMSFLGIILNPQVSAISFSLFWSRMTKLSLLVGVPLGTATGVACWVGSTYSYAGGVINKDTLMVPEATFIGNIVSLFSAGVYIVIISLIKPEPAFNMNEWNEGIKFGDDIDTEELEALKVTDKEKRILAKQANWCLLINVFILLGVYIVLTCGLYGWGGDMSKGSFTAFMVIMLIWLMASAIYIIIFPLWQGKAAMISVFYNVFGGRKNFAKVGTEDSSSEVIIEQTSFKKETDVAILEKN